jgi:hypothetical protein
MKSKEKKIIQIKIKSKKKNKGNKITSETIAESQQRTKTGKKTKKSTGFCLQANIEKIKEKVEVFLLNYLIINNKKNTSTITHFLTPLTLFLFVCFLPNLCSFFLALAL